MWCPGQGHVLGILCSWGLGYGQQGGFHAPKHRVTQSLGGVPRNLRGNVCIASSQALESAPDVPWLPERDTDRSRSVSGVAQLG